MVLISVVISNIGVIVQALVVFLLLIIFLLLNLKKEPFALAALNDLEIFSLASSIITIYCGLFFISEVPQGSKDYVNGSKNNKFIYIVTLPEWVKVVFFFFIVLSNMLFFLYWIYKMYIELKSLIIKKLERFTCFYVCV